MTQQNIRKKVVDDYIRDQDPEKIRAVHKKGVKFFINLYNGLCPNCKKICMRNPQTEFDYYCEDCKEKIMKAWNK